MECINRAYKYSFAEAFIKLAQRLRSQGYTGFNSDHLANFQKALQLMHELCIQHEDKLAAKIGSELCDVAYEAFLRVRDTPGGVSCRDEWLRLGIEMAVASDNASQHWSLLLERSFAVLTQEDTRSAFELATAAFEIADRTEDATSAARSRILGRLAYYCIWAKDFTSALQFATEAYRFPYGPVEQCQIEMVLACFPEYIPPDGFMDTLDSWAQQYPAHAVSFISTKATLLAAQSGDTDISHVTCSIADALRAKGLNDTHSGLALYNQAEAEYANGRVGDACRLLRRAIAELQNDGSLLFARNAANRLVCIELVEMHNSGYDSPIARFLIGSGSTPDDRQETNGELGVSGSGLAAFGLMSSPSLGTNLLERITKSLESSGDLSLWLYTETEKLQQDV